MTAKEISSEQRSFFQSRQTLDPEWRKTQLKKLLEWIEDNEQQVLNALEADLGKCATEAYLSEVYVIKSELKRAIKKVSKWSKPDWVRPKLLNFRSKASIYHEPYGCTLIIAPWNYPFQLAIGPLIGAIAAGNTAIIKPSEHAPATAALLKELINDNFDLGFIHVITGDAAVAKDLLDHHWDYIFFTGGSNIGKKVYQAAAKNLTPVTLELGGKNPCVVHKSADVEISARRIAWAKFLNAGQTCIAPDYVLVDESLKEKFMAQLKSELINFYGTNPQESPDYARIIHREHLKKLTGLIQDEKTFYGGDMELEDCYFSPTLIDNPSLDSPVMQDEIFGPILPVIPYGEKSELEDIIQRYPKPLAGYVFSGDSNFADWFIERFSFGGGAVNDAIVQFVNDRLPFGGVGKSGLGAYHGKHSFDTFSHHKSIVKRKFWPDFKQKYPPYGNVLEKIRKWL